MSLPHAILFDLDDTLIRAYAQPEEAWRRLLHVFSAHLDIHDDAVALEKVRVAIMEEARAFWSDQAAAAEWRLKIPEARRLSVRQGLKRLGRPDDALADRIADAFTEMRRQEYRLYPDAHTTVDALRARGVNAGDRCVVHLANGVAFLDLFLACLRLRVVMVPANVLYRGRELAHIAADADPALIVTAEEHRGLFGPEAPVVTALEAYRSTFEAELLGRFSAKLGLPTVDAAELQALFDWLSRDAREVDKYVDDPRCGHLMTNQFWVDFIDGLVSIGRADWARMPTARPIYVFSGDHDPVGKNGKGVRSLTARLRRAGFARLEEKLWENGRHEMLNETNRDAVTADLIAWFDSNRG